MDAQIAYMLVIAGVIAVASGTIWRCRPSMDKYRTWEARANYYGNRLKQVMVCSWAGHAWMMKMYGKVCRRCRLFRSGD